jgi:hypothetical protein
MKSLIRGAVFGAIVLCATLAVTESFGAACEEQEGQAFWDCYARVSSEALSPTKQVVESERQTTSQRDPVKTLEEQAQYDAAQRARYEALQQEVRELAAQKEREADRQAYREAAALQALGMALSGGDPMRSYAPVYQPPVMQPFTPYTPTPRSRFNCLSQQYGNQTLTNCQ